MKGRISSFHLVTLAVFLSAGACLVGFTQHTHLKREVAKRAQREAAELATAEELRRRGEEPDLPFAVEEKALREQGPEHWLVELKVRYRNERDQPLVLESPVAGVKTADGQPVPEFFLAFAPRPVVGAKAEEEVALRYWLTGEQRRQALWLEIDGDRLELDF